MLDVRRYISSFYFLKITFYVDFNMYMEIEMKKYCKKKQKINGLAHTLHSSFAIKIQQIWINNQYRHFQYYSFIIHPLAIARK